MHIETITYPDFNGVERTEKFYFNFTKAELMELEISTDGGLSETIKNIIDSKEIAGYKIPDSITISRNGQKISVTPNDFFNYIYRVDNENKSAYQRDLEAEEPSKRLNDEILRAYLKFTGGSYADLVNMAINQEKVNNLKLKAKQNANSKSIKINRTTNTKQTKDIDLGYN